MLKQGNDHPVFSIITVTYNDSVGLASTMNSIASQHFQNFEWLVIDGASKDSTVALLKQCNQAGLRWISEKDDGIYDAMNKGLSRSIGEYILFLNAGDVFANSDTLESVYRMLVSEKMPDVLFGGTEYMFQDGSSLLRFPKTASKCMWHGLPANHQATYYRRSTLGSLLYDLRYKICGDYYLIARLYNEGISTSYMNLSLVKFEVGGASYSNRTQLFLEPYYIQRDILKQALIWRLISFCKRAVSTLGMLVLQNIHHVKRIIK